MATSKQTVPALKPEVAAYIAKWKPLQHDLRIQNVVAPVARSLVAAASPSTPTIARTWLAGVCQMMAWADKTLGSLAAEVINPRNVVAFLGSHCKRRSPNWKHCTRTVLKRVGRAVNPQAWEAKHPPIRRPPIAWPYDAATERLLEKACRLPGAGNAAGRLWVVAASCGAGLRGPELHAAEVSDIHEWGDERLAVQVRWHQPRLVPVRENWTDTIRRAVASVENRSQGSSRRFVTGNSPSVARNQAGSLVSADGQSFSLRRARATWFTAHLAAGTPLPVLKMLAGSLSGAALLYLVDALDMPLTPEEAVTEGMRI